MPNAALSINFSHSIFYNTHDPVPAGEIAEALIAFERLAQRSPVIFRKLVPGMPKMRVEVLVQRLESGSLYEDLVVKLIFGSQEEMDRAIARFRKKLGINLNSKSGIIRTIILAAALLGATYAITSHLGEKVAENLEIHNYKIIIEGAKELNMAPEELLSRVSSAVSNKDKLASDSVAMLKPAKRDPNSEIKFDNSEALIIPSVFIRQVPSEFTPDKVTESKTIDAADIHLRASDLDSNERGWAAVVPIVSPRRLPIEIGANINPDNLFGSKNIEGTVEVISRRTPQGKMQLRSYRLLSVSNLD